MNYRILFLFSIALFLSLSIAGIVVLPVGTIQVGTPVCQLFNDPSGTHCAAISCNDSEPSGGTCYDDLNQPTHLYEQTRQICEFANTSNCHVSEPLACDLGNKSASYRRECSGADIVISSRKMSCPLSCTCPQPIGQKPCRRATWDTNTCQWNVSRCNDIGICDSECFEPNPECPCYGGGELLTAKDK
jgi:hypothetical protein